jgi:hypothetical protein
MPSIEIVGLSQKAVLWALSSYDKRGEPTVITAAEIDVRWEWSKRVVMSKDGTPIALSAEVMVDRVIAPGSIMWLGELTAVPSPPTNLHEVVGYDETPDIKNREYQRNVSLTKWRDVLPTIV